MEIVAGASVAVAVWEAIQVQGPEEEANSEEVAGEEVVVVATGKAA